MAMKKTSKKTKQQIEAKWAKIYKNLESWLRRRTLENGRVQYRCHYCREWKDEELSVLRGYYCCSECSKNRRGLTIKVNRYDS